jgi:hypothetical protein
MTIVKNGITGGANVHRWVTASEPRGLAPPQVTAERSELQVTMQVNDRFVKAALPGFDGLERPFALVPRQRTGELTWERVPLTFAGTDTSGVHGLRNPEHQTRIDRYLAVGVFDVDTDAIRSHGIALGMDTNVGTVWAQAPGENLRAFVAATPAWKTSP